MEKIRDSISKDLPPLRLYADDMRELHEFVISIAEDVTLEAEGYRLASPEELAQLPVREIHNLELGARRPYIRIRLTHFSAQIYVGQDDVEAAGIASRLETILLKGRAKVYFVPSGFWGGLIASLPFWIGVSIKNTLIAGIGLAIGLAYFIVAMIDSRFQLKRYSTVLPVKRKEESSFWNRNKDHLLMLLIGAVIGAVFTMLPKWFAALF